MEAIQTYAGSCQCGVKPFYVHRSNPDGMDVNVNGLDGDLPEQHMVDFDGQDWESNADSLAHKSKEA
ncbi:MAG: hypothetical protein AAGG55_15990 [Pseudomonadota bacterium]